MAMRGFGGHHPRLWKVFSLGRWMLDVERWTVGTRVPPALFVGKASWLESNIHRSGQAVAEHAPFPRPRAAVEAIDGIPVVGGHVEIPVRPELNHLGPEAVAGERAHPFARRAELHHAVVEEARHIDGAVGSEIESRGPIRKGLCNGAESSAASSFESQDNVMHMARDVDRAVPPADPFGAAGLSRQSVDERAVGAVVAKDSAAIAASHVEVAVRSEDQVHRTLQTATRLVHENAEELPGRAVILEDAIVEHKAGDIEIAVRPKGEAGGAV